MEVYHYFDSTNLTQVKDHLVTKCATVQTVGKEGKWRGVLDLLLHTCRANQKLRRKLVTPHADFDVLCRLLLQDANRKLTGDSIFTRSELYELKSILTKCRSEGTFFSGDNDSTVNVAANQYKEFLSKCNLVDIWGVCTEYNKLTTAKSILLLMEPPSSCDIKILEALGCDGSLQVSIQDDEIDCEERVHFSELSEITCEENSEDSTFGVDCQEVESWISFCRLLVNSRDELSVARLVTGSGLLTHDQCQVVRKETANTKLTMLQNMVSYATQTELGGKSYAPGEEHPFLDFQPSIVELVKLVESAQTKVESIKDPELAIQKVTSLFKAWLLKRGVKSRVDIVDTWSRVSKILKERSADNFGTPGSGLIGKPVMNVLTGLVDLYSCISSEPDSPEHVEAKTPARSKKLTRFFRTPATQSKSSPLVQDMDQEGDEFEKIVAKEGVGDKFLKKESNDVNSETPVRPQYARYKSSLAWAQDSSPVPESAERENVRVFGSTLVCAGGNSPGTPVSSVAASSNSVTSILEEIEEKQMKERNEELDAILRKAKAPPEKKSRKRILVKEAESDMMEKYGVENKKPKHKDGVENKKPKQDVEKKEKRQKKKPATPKGQKKLTAFFRP
eukprot:TRINITY_DN8696_c0_g1_i6.p1 TRINITY_DN8696_c0_g1~~TRINITY_DN8696_c0_g1_i6.p1  ORF type:complete len:619 (+),score=110.83 TRINITY_DN8696_c0_g1_i6:64-1920(+)